MAPQVAASYVITGAPGSGKTPVLRELVALGYVGVPEAAREILAEQRAIDGRGLPERDPALFVRLILERCVSDLIEVSSSDGPVFFDRGVPDAVGYYEIFGLDPAPARDEAKRHRYNDLVFALPPWPEIYTADDERTMTFEQAAAFGEIVTAVYAELGYTVMDVPKSSPAERARFIQQTIAKVSGAGPT